MPAPPHPRGHARRAARRRDLDGEHDPERQHDDREQEVREHEPGVQVVVDGERAERRLQQRAEEDREGEPAQPPREARQDARRRRSRASARIVRNAKTRFENSMYEWKLFGSKWCGWQPGQCSQPRPEPVRRTVAPVATISTSITAFAQASRRNALERERRTRTRASGCAPASTRSTVARRASRASPRRSTVPTRARKSPARANSASSAGPLSRGQRDEQPAGRLRVVGELDELGRDARRRSTGAYSRLLRVPAVETPARAASSAPASAGSRAASIAIRTPLRVAISCAWPSSPKPVTSVTAFGAKRAQQRRLRRGSACASSAPPRPGRRGRASRRRARAPCRAASSGRARRRAARPTSARSRPAATVPTTASPYFGSASRIVCPPARIAPAARTCRSAPSKIARTTSVGSSSGNAATESASSGDAAHREDVVERVRRGDRAEVVRVVDDRREEVDREDERPLVVEPVDRGVVGRVEPDEQVLGLGRHEAAQQLLEPRGRVLRGAAACGREIGELHHADEP